MTKLDLKEYAAQLAAINGRHTMAPVIEKELLHYEILAALEDAGLLSDLVFQGGTCLRLCYGANRYSEDLDFAGGTAFDVSTLHEVKSCIEKALPEQYLVSTSVQEPRQSLDLVKKWRIKVDTSTKRPDIPAQRISLEVAAIPAYTKQPHMLQMNYEGLLSSYEDMIVNTESLEEILADKIESYVCSAYLRHRDLWDMHWLLRRPGINLDTAHELRKLKEHDYHEEERFQAGLHRIKFELDQTIEGPEFKQQMKRFLPLELFEKTVGNPSFRIILNREIQELYSRY